MPIEMQVADVRRAGERHVLMLEGRGRELKIWVGPAEAFAIAALLEDVELPRPGTHHLAAALLAATGSSVSEVRIARLAESTFYADVALANGTEVDARPSDALALALVEDASIFVEREVLDGAAQSEIPGELLAVLDSPADARVIAEETRARIAELPRP